MYVIVDSHEDIAYNMLSFDRDYLRSAADTRAIEKGSSVPDLNGNTLLGWPDYMQGCVKLIFSTLFIVPGTHDSKKWGRMVYHDDKEAESLLQAQIDAYCRLTNQHTDKFILIKTTDQIEQLESQWHNDRRDCAHSNTPVGLIMLLEGAEAISDFSLLHKWWEYGVRIIGPVWAGTKYCGGTFAPGSFTSEGYNLLDEMVKLGYILDISHMSEKSVLEALDYYDGDIIASHANAKSLIKNVSGERHLTDEAIVSLAERGGVIGVIPYNKFLYNDWVPAMDRQCVTIEMVADQIDHICQITGSDAHVGIGTDFDGGFGYPEVPFEINTISDLQIIAQVLDKRGFTNDSIRNIMGYNWVNRLIRSLPED